MVCVRPVPVHKTGARTFCRFDRFLALRDKHDTDAINPRNRHPHPRAA